MSTFTYKRIEGLTYAAYAVADKALGDLGRIDKFVQRRGRGIPDRIGWKATGADGFIAHEGSNCAPTRLLAAQRLREHAALRKTYPFMQIVLFIDFMPMEDDMVARRAIPTPIPVQEHQIRRVWTLPRWRDRSSPPELPFHPSHNINAFAEDYIHDWNIHKGMFRYASRATDAPAWVLIELH